MSNKTIYFDHAATTPLDPRVKEAMESFFIREFGNPNAIYSLGHRARVAIDNAREKVAEILGARADEIIFTGGGTESNNLAILGMARASLAEAIPLARGLASSGHIITAKIEHHAVLEPCHYLEKQGFAVTYLPVDKLGLVDPKAVERVLRPDTILVSVMYANNEIGAIQPIAEIGRVIRDFRKENPPKPPIKKGGGKGDLSFPLFHTDACQAAGYLDLNTQKLGVDLMTINGGKIYGPKGAGVLYKRRDIKLEPLFYGGGQEGGLRSGTENVPAIIGMAAALELAQKEKKKETQRLSRLRDYLINGILKTIPKSFLNGHPTQRLPNNVNVTILDIEGEALVLYLDERGVMCSTGSACTSSTLEPSHVLLALGLPPSVAHGSLRLTLGRKNTKKECDYFLEVLPAIVKKLRSISPVKLRFVKLR